MASTAASTAAFFIRMKSMSVLSKSKMTALIIRMQHHPLYTPPKAAYVLVQPRPLSTRAASAVQRTGQEILWAKRLPERGLAPSARAPFPLPQRWGQSPVGDGRFLAPPQWGVPPIPRQETGSDSARPSSAWRSLRALQTPAPSRQRAHPFGIPALGGGRVRLAKFAV